MLLWETIVQYLLHVQEMTATVGIAGLPKKDLPETGRFPLPLQYLPVLTFAGT
jgi:hypothetical protein